MRALSWTFLEDQDATYPSERDAVWIEDVHGHVAKVLWERDTWWCIDAVVPTPYPCRVVKWAKA